MATAPKNPPVGRDHDGAKHVSSTERFTDNGLHVVPWTEDMACRKARVDPTARRSVKLAAFRGALEANRLPAQARAALVAAGYTELRVNR